MSHGSFATAINCMDGRTQIPVLNYIRKKCGVDYVDLITESGSIKILAENKDEAALNSIKRRLDISTAKHGSNHVAVVGHHDCAGNAVEKETQLKQILVSIKTIRSLGFKGEIIGLWVDEHWEVHEIE